MIVLVAQVWFPWRRGEEVGEYGMLDAAFWQKSAQSLVQLTKIYKVSLCVLLMEDGELPVLCF